MPEVTLYRPTILSDRAPANPVGALSFSPLAQPRPTGPLGSGSVPARPPHRRRLAHVLALVLAVLVASTGCQVKVAVDTRVDGTGKGTVAVSVALDDDAVGRLGDPATEIHTEDLAAAGWAVTGPTREDDGLTWIRAEKAVAGTDDLNRTLAEVAGAEGALRGFGITTIDTEDATVYRLNGTIDLTKGLAPYSDPELAAALDGDPFGGQIAKIEAEEGRPVADMVQVTVTARVGDGPVQRYSPTLTDTRIVEVEATQVVPKPPNPQSIVVYAVIGLLFVVIVVLMLVRVRRRFGAQAR